MSNTRRKVFLPVLIVYLLLTAFFVFGRNVLQDQGVSTHVLIMGNSLLFLITFISFSLALRGLNNPNPHAFVRSVYMSVMLKLFACIIAAFVYISLYKSNLNKPALFLCMALYLVYTFLEVASLMKLLKQKRNA